MKDYMTNFDCISRPFNIASTIPLLITVLNKITKPHSHVISSSLSISASDKVILQLISPVDKQVAAKIGRMM